MGRDRGPKHKRSRREGRDLYGTGGESLQRRLQTPPGMHGRKPRPRQSEYARQIPDVQEQIEIPPPMPAWLERKDGGGRVLRDPMREEVDLDIDERLIVEFYSR